MNNDELFEAIDTERIRLRCPRRNDAITVAGLLTPGISRWLASWPAPMTEQTAATRILKAREEIAESQALHFLVEHRADHAVMGWICVSRSETHSGVGNLSYWLNEAYHRYGYTTEASTAAVTVAFEWLNLDSMEGGAQVDNVASFAVMQRLGMELCGERIVWASTRCRNELCMFYSVTRDKFAQHQHNGIMPKIVLKRSNA